MKHSRYKFSNSSTDYYFDHNFRHLKKLADPKNSIVITDANVYMHHQKKFESWNVFVLKAGEEFKVQSTVDSLIDQLIDNHADRSTTLIGVGGGVITDLTGFVASIFMRGIQFGFIPTTLLGLVDASIGGKNGIDVDVYKNMVGTIRQPSFILHDLDFLKTLPLQEWINGFAEIIKHAAIKDAAMFKQLESGSLKNYQGNKKLLSDLVERNAKLKIKVVQQDEFEKGDRKLLNFGHTIGHALENQYDLSHGQAIAIGMSYASYFSQELIKFKELDRVIDLLEKYKLPTDAEFDTKKVFDVLKMDKKRQKKEINYILLEKVGKGVIKSIPLAQLEKIFANL